MMFQKLSITGLLLYVVSVTPTFAQQRGQWLSGMASTNSGVMPPPGFTYANLFYYSSSGRLKGPDGQGIPVDGQFAIMVDNNVFGYVFKPKILGANFETMADVAVANGSLAGTILAAGIPTSGGGGGLANMYVVPAQLGWHTARADIQAGYAFFAPTGRYTAGANNNVGTGYWSNGIQTGATFYLTKNKATAVNAFNIYSWNTKQAGTNITPGQNDSIDYSVTQMLPLGKGEAYLLQIGVVGYGQWQTSDRQGVAVPALAASRFGVNAVGFAANLLMPGKKLSVGTSSFWEMGATNTREGLVLMISAAFTL